VPVRKLSYKSNPDKPEEFKAESSKPVAVRALKLEIQEKSMKAKFPISNFNIPWRTKFFCHFWMDTK
jgi:hypothetical protein